MDVLVFAAGLATMIPAHQVADHVFSQSDKVATDKTLPGFAGWSAIFSHVVQYHAIMLFMLVLVDSVFSLHMHWYGIAAAIMFSAISHAILDRRWPVKLILEKTGSPKFAEMITPLWGMYAADQGLHYACLWLSAILLAT